MLRLAVWPHYLYGGVALALVAAGIALTRKSKMENRNSKVGKVGGGAQPIFDFRILSFCSRSTFEIRKSKLEIRKSKMENRNSKVGKVGGGAQPIFDFRISSFEFRASALAIVNRQSAIMSLCELGTGYPKTGQFSRDFCPPLLLTA